MNAPKNAWDTRLSVYWQRSSVPNAAAAHEAAQGYGMTVLSTSDLDADEVISIGDIESIYLDGLLPQLDADDRVTRIRVNAPITVPS